MSTVVVPAKLRRALDVYAFEAKTKRTTGSAILFDHAKEQLLDEIVRAIDNAVANALMAERSLMKDVVEAVRPRHVLHGYVTYINGTYSFHPTRPPGIESTPVYREMDRYDIAMQTR